MIKEIQINPLVATYLNQVGLNVRRCISYIFGASGTGDRLSAVLLPKSKGTIISSLCGEGIQLNRIVYRETSQSVEFSKDLVTGLLNSISYQVFNGGTGRVF